MNTIEKEDKWKDTSSASTATYAMPAWGIVCLELPWEHHCVVLALCTRRGSESASPAG